MSTIFTMFTRFTMFTSGSEGERSRSAIYMHIYIEGIEQTLLSKATYNNYICQ